jgi:RNA polymerase sigma-70 factor (ECF subfamily)
MPEYSGTFASGPAITVWMQHSDSRGAQVDSDELLARRTAAGDREAFAALYRRHHGSVYRFARLMTGSAAAAEDVVQEVFLVLMKDAARYDGARASLSTYLFGVARRHTRRRLLRERRFVPIETAGSDKAWLAASDAAAEHEQACELQRLRAAILSLPSRYREVVILCELEGLTYESAAATIGCALGTVRSRLHRARQLLATKLRRSGASRGAEPAMRCAV